MLVRLPFLFLGALGLPVALFLSLGLMLAQWRTGQELEAFLPVTAVGSALLLVWLWSARGRVEPGDRRLIALSARAAPWLSLPGALVGIVLGGKAHLDYVARHDTARDERAQAICYELLHKGPACRAAAKRCMEPGDRARPTDAELACIEEKLR